MYKELITKLIKKYGRLCTVTPAGSHKGIKVYAIINPLLYSNKMYLNDIYLPDGRCDKGHYLYIGDSGVRLDNMPIGTVVKCGTNEYIIMRSEQYYIEYAPIYTWAVLQLKTRSEENI